MNPTESEEKQAPMNHSICDALAFVDKVKLAFDENGVIYDNFLGILQNPNRLQ